MLDLRGFNSQFGSFDDVLSQDLPENELLEKVKAYVQDVLKWLVSLCMYTVYGRRLS